jgi:hypothetical protein
VKLTRRRPITWVEFSLLTACATTAKLVLFLVAGLIPVGSIRAQASTVCLVSAFHRSGESTQFPCSLSTNGAEEYVLDIYNPSVGREGEPGAYLQVRYVLSRNRRGKAFWEGRKETVDNIDWFFPYRDLLELRHGGLTINTIIE